MLFRSDKISALGTFMGFGMLCSREPGLKSAKIFASARVCARSLPNILRALALALGAFMIFRERSNWRSELIKIPESARFRALQNSRKKIGIPRIFFYYFFLSIDTLFGFVLNFR